MSRIQKVRSAAAPAAKRILLKGGLYSALRRLRPSRVIAILRYHAVCDPGAGYADPGICVSPARFEDHLRYLGANYAVVSLPEAVATLRDGGTLPPNAVAITFDDGYADNLEAARALHRHGMSATFYITAGCMSGGEPFWPAELRAMVSALRSSPLRLQVNGKIMEFPVLTASDRLASVRRITRLFKSHPIPVREDLRRQLREVAGSEATSSVMLTWDDIREMHRLGMTIGAHTLTHPNLPSAGLADATIEIVGSKARLEREVGAEITMFSYPNGGAERYYTPELQAIVREAGYAAAATSWNGFAGPASDPYALERVQVSERLEELVFALEVERFAFKPVPRGRMD